MLVVSLVTVVLEYAPTPTKDVGYVLEVIIRILLVKGLVVQIKSGVWLCENNSLFFIFDSNLPIPATFEIEA